MFLNAVIETERLIIRPYSLADLDELYSVVIEKNFYQYIPEEVPTRDDVENIIKWSIEQNKKNTKEKIYKFNLSIIHKEDNRLIGYCGLGPDDLGMGETEIYYGISGHYRKQGLAFEAAKAVLKYGFEVINLPRIVAFADERNQASIKLLEKNGMRYHFKVRELPEKNKDFDGQSYYTLLAEDYFRE